MTVDELIEWAGGSPADFHALPIEEQRARLKAAITAAYKGRFDNSPLGQACRNLEKLHERALESYFADIELYLQERLVINKMVTEATSVLYELSNEPDAIRKLSKALIMLKGKQKRKQPGEI